MTNERLTEIITKLPEVVVDERSTDQYQIYSLRGEVVAVVKVGANPPAVELRCDPNLAHHLIEHYESASEAKQMNKRRFVSLIWTSQFSDQDMVDQVRHAYEMTRELLGLSFTGDDTVDAIAHSE